MMLVPSDERMATRCVVSQSKRRAEVHHGSGMDFTDQKQALNPKPMTMRTHPWSSFSRLEPSPNLAF